MFLVEDTEEMIGCQLDVRKCWKRIAGQIEEEVLDKYKVDNGKRETYRGSGAPLEWRLEEARNIEYTNGVTAWQESSLGSETTICSVCKVCRKARPRRKR